MRDETPMEATYEAQQQSYEKNMVWRVLSTASFVPKIGQNVWNYLNTSYVEYWGGRCGGSSGQGLCNTSTNFATTKLSFVDK